MILPLFVALERIDPALLEAAGDLGATSARTLSGASSCRWRCRASSPAAILVGDPGHRRVRDPGDPRRRQDADVRQRRLRPVPRLGDYPFGAALAIALMAAADGRPGVRSRVAPLQGGGGGIVKRRLPEPHLGLHRVRAAAASTCRSSSWSSTPQQADETLIGWSGFTTHWSRRRSTTRRCATTC